MAAGSVTLLAYHESADPHDVSRSLELKPSRFQRVGDRSDLLGMVYNVSSWQLDVHSHGSVVDTLQTFLNTLETKSAALSELRNEGWEIRVLLDFNFRLGTGPTIPHYILDSLALLELPLSLGESSAEDTGT